MIKYIQGDVVGVYDNTGAKVAEYAYDAYGNCTIVSQQAGVGTLNPFRYRGYYWDSDLGLYYLQTRYYDPVTGRFINADGLEYLDPQTLGGINLYSYCGNNPIMETDPHGTIVLSAIIWGFIIGFVMSFTVSAVSQAVNNEGEVNWGVAVVEGLFGGLSGALAATGLGAGATWAIDTALDFTCNIITTSIEKNGKLDGYDLSMIFLTTSISAFSSAVIGKFGPDIDRNVIKDANQQVRNINKKLIGNGYATTKAMNNAIKSAKSYVNVCFTKGRLYVEYARQGVQNIIDTIIGAFAQ